MTDDAWVDLEPVLVELSPNLASGELVHDDAFSLFDAMSALDVGDPKMDAGARAREVVAVEEIISSGRAPLELEANDLVLEADALLACECAFRSGHAAATTLWSNARVATRANRTASGTASALEKCLSSLVSSTVASARRALEIVKLGDVYEEEDFAVQGELLERDGDAGETSGSDGDERRRALDALEKDTSIDATCKAAIRVRLEFREEHGEMMALLASSIGNKGDGVEKAREKAKRAKACLEKMRERYANVEDADALDWDPSGGSFSHGMSTHLLGGAPPRQVTFLSRRRAIDYFDKEIDDVLVAADVFKFRARGSVPTIEAILDSLETLQDVRPGAVALGLVAAELLHDQKLCGVEVGKVGLQSAWTHICVENASLENSFAHSKENLDKFKDECVQPLTILVRSFCVNRARFRRCLRRSLGELSHLQAAADALDAAEDVALAQPSDSLNVQILQSLKSPFLAWTEHLTATVQLRHIELGFSLNLYLPHEYPMIYFYMQNLQILQTNEMKRRLPLIMRNAGPEKNVMDSDDFSLVQFNMLKLLMYIALQYTFMALIERGKVRKCETAFSGEDLRYWQRFSTFQTVDVPQAKLYEDYVAIVASNVASRKANMKKQGHPEADSDIAACVETASLMYVQAREAAKTLLKSTALPPTRLRVVRTAERIAARNAVSLKVLLTTDMVCEIDDSDEFFVAVTARKPTE